MNAEIKLTELPPVNLVLLQMVHQELARDRASRPTQIPDAPHAYAVLDEELDQFWDEALERTPNAEFMLIKLLQIAAAAIRAASDVAVPLLEPLEFTRIQIERESASQTKPPLWRQP